MEEPLPQGGFQPPPLPERALPILQTAAGSTEFPEPPSLETRSTSRRPLILFLILLAAAGLWAGLRWYKRNPIILPRLTQSAPQDSGQNLPNSPKPEPDAATSAPKPEAAPAPEAKPATEPAPAAPAPVAPTPVASPKPAPRPATVPSKAERLKAIREGKWKLTLTQGAALAPTIRGRWTLRLEIACQGETVQHAAGLLKDRDPDLFILPMAMRNGRICYQVFLGHYASEAEALAAAKRLPTPFLTAGNRPRPFRVDDIPSRQ